MPTTPAPAFEDVQERHRLHPATFEVPTDEELDALAPGDYVKVILEGERFWLQIEERIDDYRFTGVVSNELVVEHDGLGFGELVRFERRHVCGIDDEEGQVCRVCGCTDDDCSGCIERTGHPCSWVEEDLCSACKTIVDAVLEPISTRAPLPKKLTYSEAYDPAMKMTEQAEADEYFERLVVRLVDHFGESRTNAERVERANLGYYAGYYDSETRARVERLFRCAHPVFGAIAENGPPSQEDAFEMGIQAARSSEGQAP